MKSSQETLPGPVWHEPIEGLEFGELILGTIASTYLARGRVYGYGFCFTDRRVIGLKMRRLSLVLKAPFIATVVGLYLFVIFQILSGTALLLGLLLPAVVEAAHYPIAWLTNRISESVLSQKTLDPSYLLKRRRDFEVQRNEIEEILMKSPGKGLSLSRMGNTGYLRIMLKDVRLKPIEIKIRGWKQHQRLRELVISFTSREPKVKALEYP